MTRLERARAAAAERYPEHLIDTQGREHPCIPRKAILSGQWDAGALVRRLVAEMDGREG